MDELKRSLEEAIKELQDDPAVAQPNSLARVNEPLPNRQKLILERAMAGGRVASIPAPVAPVSVPAPTPIRAAPAANSIEAALAMAPSVSPHYVPPLAPAPKPQPAVSIPIPAPAVSVPNPHPTDTPRERVVATLEESLVQSVRPESAVDAFAPVRTEPQGDSVPVALQRNSIPAARARPATIEMATPAPVPVVRNVETVQEDRDLSSELADKAKKLRDKIWRWATIGISCAGGLASGWLGSSVSDQANGLMQSGMQTLTGEVSNAIGEKLPMNVKMVTNGKAVVPADHMTGKTDRAVPINENHCTVLERDQATGLTLSKPCNPIETAGYSSTLGKSDLLVKPR